MSQSIPASNRMPLFILLALLLSGALLFGLLNNNKPDLNWSSTGSTAGAATAAAASYPALQQALLNIPGSEIMVEGTLITLEPLSQEIVSQMVQTLPPALLDSWQKMTDEGEFMAHEASRQMALASTLGNLMIACMTPTEIRPPCQMMLFLMQQAQALCIAPFEYAALRKMAEFLIANCCPELKKALRIYTQNSGMN